MATQPNLENFFENGFQGCPPTNYQKLLMFHMQCLTCWNNTVGELLQASNVCAFKVEMAVSHERPAPQYHIVR